MGLKSVPITFVAGNWFAVPCFRYRPSITKMREEVKRTKFNSPHPSPSADIKHVIQTALEVFDWRVEELAAESQEEEMMLEICLLLAMGHEEK